MNYATSDAGIHSWECFKELLADGEPHKLSEIVAYTAEKAQEKGIEGLFDSKSVWFAVRTRIGRDDPIYGRPLRGFYQLRSAMGNQEDAPPIYRRRKNEIETAEQAAVKGHDWYDTLDMACDLEEVLKADFSQDQPLPDMTAADWQVYRTSGNGARENIDQVISQLSFWIAQMEDHYNGFSRNLAEEHETAKASANRDKYFTELSRRLAQQGLRTQQQAGALEVILDTRPVCVVSPDGAVWRRPGDEASEAAYEAYHAAAREAKQVYEYMTAIEATPTLKAGSLEEKYKQLADFNGYVLAAKESPHGPEFITWQWSYDHTYVTLGHYYGDNYQSAKEDFACRTGLVDPNRIFNNEQLVDLYNQVRYCLDEGFVEFGPDAEKQLEGILDQIKNVLPDVGDQYQQQETAQEAGMEMS